MQPFACLSNHVTGKGMIGFEEKVPKCKYCGSGLRPRRREVNQLNRIKLMLSAAFRNMEEGEAAAGPEREASASGQDSKASAVGQ